MLMQQETLHWKTGKTRRCLPNVGFSRHEHRKPVAKSIEGYWTFSKGNLSIFASD